ncbi:hypothetical protein BH10PSE7_BH10PSE7_44630 [soil metagenome]
MLTFLDRLTHFWPAPGGPVRRLPRLDAMGLNAYALADLNLAPSERARLERDSRSGYDGPFGRI